MTRAIDLTLEAKCEAAEILYRPDKVGLEYPCKITRL